MIVIFLIFCWLRIANTHLFLHSYLQHSLHIQCVLSTDHPKEGEDSSAHTDLTHLYTHPKSLICAHRSDSSVHTTSFWGLICTHTHTFGVGGWGGDGNIPWTCIHSQLYTHTQNQLLLLLTCNTTAKDLYKTTCTHGAHKIHSCKNKLVHTANPCRCHAKKRKQKQHELPCTAEPTTITFNPQYNC